MAARTLKWFGKDKGLWLIPAAFLWLRLFPINHSRSYSNDDNRRLECPSARFFWSCYQWAQPAWGHWVSQPHTTAVRSSESCPPFQISWVEERSEGRQMDSVPSWSPALILEKIQATQIRKTEVSIAIVTAGSLGRRAVSWPPVPAMVLMGALLSRALPKGLTPSSSPWGRLAGQECTYTLKHNLESQDAPLRGFNLLQARGEKYLTGWPEFTPMCHSVNTEKTN